MDKGKWVSRTEVWVVSWREPHPPTHTRISIIREWLDMPKPCLRLARPCPWMGMTVPLAVSYLQVLRSDTRLHRRLVH